MYSHDQKLITQFHFQYWSGYFYINPAENGYYSVLASLIYVGAVDDEDASSFSRHFKDLLSKYQENIYSTSVKSYDTWYDKVIAQNEEAPEMVNPQSPMIDMSTVLINKTIILERADDFIDTLWKMWYPRCFEDYSQPCNLGYLFMISVPRDNRDYDGMCNSFNSRSF